MAIAERPIEQSVSARLGLSWLPVLAAGSLVLTGASSLMYQVVWFRSLGLIFGVTVQATSAVLAAFMAGLALGSLAVGPLLGRLKHPLRAYGVAELTVGVAGLLSLPAFDLLTPLYQSLARSSPDSLTAVTALRFGLAALIMLVPTTLMGATLPIVVTAFKEGAHSGTVGRLYAANTAGAISGAFLAGFVFIGAWGLTGTTLVAAALNVIVGAAWLVAGGKGEEGKRGKGSDQILGVRGQGSGAGDALTRVPSGCLSPAGERESGDQPVAPTQNSELRTQNSLQPSAFSLQPFVLATYAVSGGLALALEVVWTRVLSGIFPGTVYAFALMLCAILTGIAVGSAISRPLVRRAGPLGYAGLQVLTGFGGVLSLYLLAQSNAIEGAIRRSFGLRGDLLTTEPWFMMVFGLVALGPAALLMGLLFPVAAKLYGDGRPDIGRRLGQIYGANTVGAITGSLLGGLLLIPTLGVQQTLWLLSAGYVAAGLVIAVLVGFRSGPSARRAGALALAGAAGLAAGWQIVPDLYRSLSASDPRGERLIWYHEGQDATVRVVRNPENTLILYINSEGQATDAGSELNYHYKLGHLGPILHPNPKEILVVGLGGGPTPGAVATHARARITVVELFPGVIAAARLFDHVNYGVLDRPNVDLRVNDGRNHLLLTGKKYDVIVADPILPTNAGAGNLYSADYYRLARAALNEDGIMVQWVNNTLPEFAYRMMIRTFLEVFPDSTMWYDGTALVGSLRPTRLDRQAIAVKFQDPALREPLATIGIRSVNDVVREFVARPDELREYVGNGPIITDRYPAIEYLRSLPPSDTAPDLRWRRLAGYLSAREEKDDGILYGDQAIRPLLEHYHGTNRTSLIAPRFAKGQERAIEQTLDRFLAERGRVWFLPFYQTETDVFVENWLNTHAYKALNRQLGNQRVTLYLSSAGEPALRPTAQQFADLLRLTGWSLDRSEIAVGEVARIALAWRAEDDLDDNLKVLLRLVDDRGRIAASSDRLPNDTPTNGWHEGTRLVDRIGLYVPPGTPPGTYRIDLTVYHERTGQPLHPDGATTADGRIVLGRVTVRDDGRVFSPNAIEADPATAQIGPLRLAATTIDEETVRRPGDFLPATLYWQLLADSANRSGTILLGDLAQPRLSQPLQAGDANRKSGAIVRQDLSLRIPPGTPARILPLWLRFDGVDPVLLGRIEIASRPALPSPPAPDRPLDIRFADWATLAGISTRQTNAGIEVALVWRAEREVDRPYLAFVHLLDSSGRLIAQSDQPPGPVPTSGWSGGDRYLDRHQIRATPPPGSRLLIGLYDPTTLTRVPTPGGDAAIVEY